MKTSSKIRSSIATLGFSLALCSNATASQEFPSAIQEAAGMPCTPSCVLCHGVDPGTAATFMNKALGKALFSGPPLVGPNQSGALKESYAAYAAKPENAAAVTALKAGVDPETGVDLCSNKVTYGCGAHIAKDAPRDDWSGLLFVAGAMGFGALLRRAKRR